MNNENKVHIGCFDFKVVIMKKGFIQLAGLLLLGMLFVAGCGKTNSNVGELKGNWGYIHEPETTVLSVKENGKTVFEGKNYTIDVAEDFITLSSSGESEKMRYVLDKDGLLLYKNTVYYLEGDSSDGIVGRWVGENGKWSFEFTENGTFQEDGYFPGYYAVDENSGVIKLMYNDHFEDTVCYYVVEGNKLTLQYPWRMVKSK